MFLFRQNSSFEACDGPTKADARATHVITSFPYNLELTLEEVGDGSVTLQLFTAPSAEALFEFLRAGRPAGLGVEVVAEILLPVARLAHYPRPYKARPQDFFPAPPDAAAYN